MATTCSTSPPYNPYSNDNKKPWWLTTKKVVDKYIKEARVMMSTREESEINSAITLLDSVLCLSPRNEVALQLKARSLLYLRRYKDVADLLLDYIPSYNSDSDSSGSSGDNSSQPLTRERVNLLASSSSNSDSDSPTCHYITFKCFSLSDLKNKVLHGFTKNCDKDGEWRYLILGQACSHLGLMEDALVLLQHGKRLATAAFRRESVSWTDDSFTLGLSTTTTTTEATTFNHQPLTESEIISNLIAAIKHLLRRRTAAIAALDAGRYGEAIRHFNKIVDSRRPAPQSFLAECYYHRSVAFKANGRIAESIADLNRTLSLEPNSTGALQARAGLFELIGCIPDAVHDLEHVKMIYNSILRDRKPPGPVWKPSPISYREIPGRLCVLGSKIQELKQRMAKGDIGSVDYYRLMGLKRGCSKSELDKAHLLLLLKHKPDRSIGFMDRVEFADDKDYDSIKDRAKMSAVLLYRLVQKGYNFVLNNIVEEEKIENERINNAQRLVVQQSQAQVEAQAKLDRTTQVQTEWTQSRAEIEPNNVDYSDDRSSQIGIDSFPYQGVFCRDLAVVSNLLSQAGFNRPLAVKYEALTC